MGLKTLANLIEREIMGLKRWVSAFTGQSDISQVFWPADILGVWSDIWNDQFPW
jgi:hypothetical protein